PWRLAGQHLETGKHPHELHLRLEADRGSLFACPECGRVCKAHDFAEFRWRHLNFFQHHCIILARVPRADCPEHGVKRVRVPWAREGSGFTLLFEQVALMLAREMPVQAAARQMAITDQRLWRIIGHYVGQALDRLDLAELRAVAFDETASKRGHNYVTIFIDLERKSRPVMFATPGKGKETISRFKDFLIAHHGKPGQIVEMVCDMSPAFLAALGESFPEASVTVDWFHVVQLFTRAVDDVRKAEARLVKMPSAVRWAVLKARERNLTQKQAVALAELEAGGLLTAVAWQIKEKLRWVRIAPTLQAARWRLSHFIRHARKKVSLGPMLDPVLTAIKTVEKQKERILRRWASTYSNARMEALNGIFKAARARARGYRNAQTFITMIYLIAAPLSELFKST
ncbi:ISL3 family transposase, partial [Acidiphilium sp. JA12-A1]|uniref:ISL3 family transposase n=1 Tax=Acidiphilium sp. JA12-A1 TaxID=1464546 RepID=UPI0005533812